MLDKSSTWFRNMTIINLLVIIMYSVGVGVQIRIIIIEY